LAAGKAARVGRSAGGQLEVNWVTAGRSSRGSVRLGSSTVLAAVDCRRNGSSIVVRKTAILAELGPYLNSHLYLLDDNILEYAYRE
jgi:hypothetical protein